MTQEDKTTSDATDEQELRGTFYSVLMIGLFLLLIWVAVFYIYFVR